MSGPGYLGARGAGDGESARRAPDTASTAELRALENQLDRLQLTCRAMWSLLQEKLNLTDVELVQRIHELDMLDGKADGKVKKKASSCPQCGRTIAAKSSRCMYCGQAVLHDPFA